MIVLPGPAILVIPAGLAILAIEFAWARHWLMKFKEYAQRVTKRKSAVKLETLIEENEQLSHRPSPAHAVRPDNT